MNLTAWAKTQGVHPKTAQRWWREGKLPVPAQRVGRLVLVGLQGRVAIADPTPSGNSVGEAVRTLRRRFKIGYFIEVEMAGVEVGDACNRIDRALLDRISRDELVSDGPTGVQARGSVLSVQFLTAHEVAG